MKNSLIHTTDFILNTVISGNLLLWIIGLALLPAVLLWIYLAAKKRRKFITERDHYLKTGEICLNMVSETVWITRGQGVHTAFLESMALLTATPKLTIKVNGHGTGNLFHSHTYGLYYFWRGRNYKGRRILTAHVIPDSSKGAIPFSKYLMPVTTWYLKKAYSYADVIIAISPTVERTLKNLGVNSKIVRINNPVLTSNWKRTPENRLKGREKLGITNGETLVIGVGQLQQRKGVEDFMDIATAIVNSRFAWIGGRPWGVFTEGINRINKRIDDAPANITFTGLLDIREMSEMYAAADIFLFPSYQENSPLAPMEAAASGLPVIFRDIKEYESLYNHPYLKAATTAEFISITENLIADQQYYQSAVTMSYNLLKEFDKEKIKGDVLALYRQTLEDYFKLTH
ncbi:glycosyltransferase family 4 protein [Mucilaginibacter sp.]|uniref:glycosyltransferase family 4 protein n=1 Tax=Mucilaginibacter sp. TaxID=1882438 RepID=UPI0028495161|nr:glycosyltransferase family 4 protein [Mucilaginibacter sp.]MDR3696787.1 glycosyltransferase family 4 protein [Mucilaginibacter sp.]